QRSMHAHTSDIIVNLTLRIAKLCERIVYKEAETRYSIGLIYLPRIAAHSVARNGHIWRILNENGFEKCSSRPSPGQAKPMYAPLFRNRFRSTCTQI
ncbi:MAG: hypothetical protein Q8R24_08360, partial [Legionellaceae bacterium]|nr:hypothetical protein [Legionellaceae bacterium]